MGGKVHILCCGVIIQRTFHFASYSRSTN